MTSARRPTRSRAAARPSRVRGDAPFDPFSALSAFLFRAPTLGLMLVMAAAALLVVTLSGQRRLEPVGAPFARVLGAGVLLVAPTLAAVGVLVYLRRLRLSRRGLRRSAGWAMAAVALWGILGWLRPDWHMAGESLHQATLGGAAGRFLGRPPWGLLIWVGCLAGASALAWPRLSRRALALLPPAARTVWRWRIPQRVWRTAIDGFRVLLRPGEASSPIADQVDDLLVAPVPEAPTGGLQPDVPAREALAAAPPKHEEASPHPDVSGWPRPPRDLLMAVPAPEAAGQDNAARAQLIVDTLASFNVDARVVSVNQGPTVTQFGIEPGWEIKTRSVVERDNIGRPILERDGRPKTHTEEVSRTRVRVNEVTRLATDLALALAAPSIRIEAPVPGRPVIGIEVPNTNAAVVSLRQVIETPAFQRLGARSKLALALGQGVSGEVVVADLAKMPHLLIAGATGSGKSVCINSLIACILMHASPDEVRFVMIDPKRVELIGYEPIPHLALSRVIVDMEDVVGTLGAVIHEMEARYRKFSDLGVRNLEAYNKSPRVVARLPQWVVIIDELADLMMAAPYEVEKQVCRLAQLARATGIHLVIATQRPSVDVITGLIKANFPTRIAFSVTSQVDSRTILDGGGAEKLLGRGDMLYLATDAAKPKRIQGVYVSDQEIERLVNFWASERFAPYRPPTFDHLLEEAKAEAEKDDEEEDPLLARARELAGEHTRISTSMLQRRLRIGYPRAARLMDLLEVEGLVGGAEGVDSREVMGGDGGG